ncbi:MAG: thiamine-phosphate kinase [Nitrospirota bacterium]
MKLSEISELALLDEIRKVFIKKSRDVIVGIGDDGSVVKPLKENLVFTTDMMVEDVHFDFAFATPFQIGFKLISVNVSDIYAMGGRPIYALLSIAAEKNTEKEVIDDLFRGVNTALDFYFTSLVGGDLSASNKYMSLSATVFGSVRKPVRRSGAKKGDIIYVTGTLGDSACGLELLKKIRRPLPFEYVKRTKSESWSVHFLGDFDALAPALAREGLKRNMLEPLIKRHLMPTARNPAGFVKYVTAMIDISDGLLIDLTRLCNESNVGARIYAERIPISGALRKISSELDISPFRFALSGGEDYELLFTAPPSKKIDYPHIGEVTESGRVIVDSRGREKPFYAEGFQHFGLYNRVGKELTK